MIFFSGLVGILLVVTAEGRVGNSSESQFCTETDECLLYDVLCKSSSYEARHYKSVKWVSTTETSMFQDYATMKAFRRLFDYITGHNDQGRKIEMTSPVVMKIPENLKFWEMNTYTMSFLLPSEHQKNPPKPKDPRVFIQQTEDMKVYVHGYDGWMMSITDKYNAHELCSNLDMAGVKYDKDYHFGVGYNSPMKMFNRHNEVWYMAKGDPECASSEEMEFSLFD